MTRLSAMILIMRMTYIKHMHPDIQKIIDKGYNIKKCTDWHYQVFHDYTLTNIWITTKKYMKDKEKTEKYIDIQEVIDTLGKPTTDEECKRYQHNTY